MIFEGQIYFLFFVTFMTKIKLILVTYDEKSLFQFVLQMRQI